MQALFISVAMVASALAADDIHTKLFILEEGQHVTSYQEVTSATSELTCVKGCTQRSGCESCAYGSATGECFLQVTSQTGGASRVFSAASLCSRSDAVDYSATNVTWRGSSLEGDLSCNDDDFMYSGDSPTVSCRYPGVWVKDGTCARRIYRNTTTHAKLWLPRSPEPGWSMCVRGTACVACDKFGMNLKEWKHYFVHFDVRFNFFGMSNTTMLSSGLEGQMAGQGYALNGTFPFALGQAFQVEFRLIDWDLLQIFVDNIFLANFTMFTPGLKFTYFIANAELDFVDVWGGCSE